MSRISLSRIVLGGKPGIRVEWRVPSSDLPIIHFTINFRKKGSRPLIYRRVGASKTSYTLENLSAGTEYQVQVRADSDLGPGQYSETSTITTTSCELYVYTIFIDHAM